MTKVTKSQRRPTTTHPAQRSTSPYLDPYAVAGIAMTLEEWRRTRAGLPAVHVVLPHSETELSA
jgi:hypothetical protein